MEVDVEKYIQKVQIWIYCVNKQRGGRCESLIRQLSGGVRSHSFVAT